MVIAAALFLCFHVVALNIAATSDLEAGGGEHKGNTCSLPAVLTV